MATLESVLAELYRPDNAAKLNSLRRVWEGLADSKGSISQNDLNTFKQVLSRSILDSGNKKSKITQEMLNDPNFSEKVTQAFKLRNNLDKANDAARLKKGAEIAGMPEGLYKTLKDKSTLIGIGGNMLQIGAKAAGSYMQNNANRLASALLNKSRSMSNYDFNPSRTSAENAAIGLERAGLNKKIAADTIGALANTVAQGLTGNLVGAGFALADGVGSGIASGSQMHELNQRVKNMSNPAANFDIDVPSVGGN